MTTRTSPATATLAAAVLCCSASATDFAVVFESTGAGVAVMPVLSDRLGTPTFFPSYEGWAVAEGDYDGDGDDDFMVYDGAVGHVIYAEMQDGAVISRTYVSWLPGYNMTAADLDGDGKDDLAMQMVQPSGAGIPTFQVAVWLMDGPIRTASAGFGPRLEWRGEPNDFTGTGRDGLLWLMPDGHYLAWDMDGTTRVSNTVVTWQPDTLALSGDLDGSGTADLLIFNEETGQMVGHLLSAAGRTGVRPYPTFPGRVPVFLGDFADDGVGDLVLWDPVTGVLHVHNYTTGAGGPTETGSPGVLTDPEKTFIYVTDFDGDGKDDLVVFDGTGEVGVAKAWLMDGATLKESVLIGTYPATWNNPALIRR